MLVKERENSKVPDSILQTTDNQSIAVLNLES